jgi:hypothetical protein
MEWVATLHSYWRWVVLLVGVAAIIFALLAMTGNRPWDALADRLALFFTISLDIQVLIGLVVWVTQQRWSGDLFLGYIHPLAMLAAVALAHIGRTRADRASDSREKGRFATLFFVGSFVVILLAIPLGSWPV